MPVSRKRLPGNVFTRFGDHWRIFRRVLSESIAGIEQTYFYLDRYEAPGTWRERVYCYELYHQLRCGLPKNFPYTLHGEIDKRGHQNICQHFRGKHPNPDFVLHDPGKEANFVVVEVKRGDADVKDIKTDIRKLRIFTESVGYDHGILLFFGPERDWDLRAINDRTQVLWHEKPGSPASLVKGNQTEWEF